MTARYLFFSSLLCAFYHDCGRPEEIPSSIHLILSLQFMRPSIIRAILLHKRLQLNSRWNLQG